jgi:MGT family glycosyltransferase
VVLRTLSAEVERMGELGLKAEAMAPEIEAIEHDDWQAGSPLKSMERSLRVFARRAGHEIDDIDQAIAAHSPDLLLIDINCWGAGMVAEKSGLPWAYFSPYFLPIPSRDAPPFGAGLKPRADILGRVRDRAVRGLIFGTLNRQLPLFNGLRLKLSLKPLQSLANAALQAPRVLYYTAPPFEYVRTDWPLAVRMVGPLPWEPPSVPPSWLTDDARPLVLATCSTEFQNDGLLIETTLAALAHDPVRVVATSGAVDTAGWAVPPNARLEPFLAHGPLVARAEVVICHGGMGITQKALAAGVPVVVVPFGRDQIEVARHVAVAGAGVLLPRAQLSPKRLREAVNKARGMTAGARLVARGFHQAGGAEAAADVLAELLPARDRSMSFSPQR